MAAAGSTGPEQAGGNPFMEYQLPEAILRFKQGFGRLIRTAYDEGIVIPDKLYFKIGEVCELPASSSMSSGIGSLSSK